jgi:secondary thiamine-phosphate synthase enzyme
LVTLEPRRRGIHLVTAELLGIPEAAGVAVGLAHLFIRHTSASLSLNENASPEVRTDLDAWLGHVVPDGWPAFAHTLEGADDMPAHVKASLMGASVTVPLRDGRPLLGTWQGVYLCEHRDHGGPRQVVVTVTGAARSRGPLAPPPGAVTA